MYEHKQARGITFCSITLRHIRLSQRLKSVEIKCYKPGIKNQLIHVTLDWHAYPLLSNHTKTFVTQQTTDEHEPKTTNVIHKLYPVSEDTEKTFTTVSQGIQGDFYEGNNPN